MLPTGQQWDFDALPRLPAGPSGILSTAPVLQVTDEQGRALAGKAVTRAVFGERLNVAEASCSMDLAELPHAGAAVTKLGMPWNVALPSGSPALPPRSSFGLEGGLSFARRNIVTSDSNADRVAYGEGTAAWPYFRVSTASGQGWCNSTWQLEVDGWSDGSDVGRLEVFNWDGRVKEPQTPVYQPPAAEICASIRIKQAPSFVLQDGALQPSAFGQDNRPLTFLGPDGKTPPPFVIETVNSYGEPVPVPLVGMYVVDAPGYVMYTAVDGQHLAMTSAYSPYLKRRGGAAAFTVGNLFTGLEGVWLHPPVHARDTNASGIGVVEQLTLRRAQNTWLRFAFVANYLNLTATQLVQSGRVLPDTPEDEVAAAGSSVWSAPAACVSQYSSTVVIRSTVGAVEWDVPDQDTLQTVAIHDAPNADTDTSFNLPHSLRLYPSEHAPLPSNLTVPHADGYVHGAPQTVCKDGGVCFVNGTFPALQAMLGDVGTFELTGLAGGLVAEPSITVEHADSANTVLIEDWDLSSDPVSCFTNTWLYDHRTLDRVGLYYDQPNPCPVAANGQECSGHGTCLCGICVCKDGWDGAYDCSERFTEDSFSLAFADAAPLGEAWVYGAYPGLPVYDVKRVMQLSRVPYMGELFPRFFLARQVMVTSLPTNVSNVEEAVAFLANYVQAPGLPSRQLTGDLMNHLLLKDPGTATSTEIKDILETYFGVPTDPAEVLPAPDPVFPVLFTCDDREVMDWAFTEGETGCPQDTVPVSSTPMSIDRNLGSWFGQYSASFFNGSGNFVYPWTEPARGFRLQLTGVPTGCYRFKYVYAPRGPGSRVDPTIAKPWENAQVRSLGASRPFRLLSPVVQLRLSYNSFHEPPIVVARGVPLPLEWPIYIEIFIRPSTSPDTDLYYPPGVPYRPLQDTCSDTVDVLSRPSGCKGLAPRGKVRRCPPTPQGGLEITVTAISTDTGVEYSLYMQGEYNDCARTGNDGTATTDEFAVVMFDKLVFPANPAPIPGGAGARTAKSVPAPAGRYKLHFNSYGTTLDTPYTITVVDAPTHLALDTDVRMLIGPSGNASYYTSQNDTQAHLPLVEGEPWKEVTASAGVALQQDCSTGRPAVHRRRPATGPHGVGHALRHLRG